MSTKLRIKFEVVVEYEPNQENYPEGHRTPDAMLAIDLANANDDPYAMVDGREWTITGEVSEE